MEAIEIWRNWYHAFEASALDGAWDRLAPFLAKDVQYRVTGVPFACVIRGREAVIAGFARSFAGFDHRFDAREHHVVGTRFMEPGHIQAQIWGVYRKEGLPPLRFPATGHWYIDEGRISLMADMYDATLLETAEAFAWLAAHGPALGGLDPSYSG